MRSALKSQINAQYAYKFKFEYGTLSIGANIGVLNLICYGDSIKMVESEETTKSGIILSSGSKEKPQIAEVIEVGPGGNVEGNNIEMYVKKGEKVKFIKKYLMKMK